MTFKRVEGKRGNGKNVFYRAEGSTTSVRFKATMFGEEPPDTIEMTRGDGQEFAIVASAGSGTPVPPDIKEAQEKLKAYRAQRKGEKDARKAASAPTGRTGGGKGKKAAQHASA